jgi:hypothetical protein
MTVAKRSLAVLLLAATGVVVVAAAFRFLHRAGQEGSTLRATQDRVERLRGQLEQAEKDAALAVERYRPDQAVRLDDLAADAATLLRGLPGVARVEVAVKAERPTARIVHLLDLHSVPLDLHAADLRAAAGRPLTDEEVAELHDELLLEVELVQLEQTALLRCLVKHHGLHRVLAEGLTPAGKPGYDALIDALRRAEADAGVLRLQWVKAKRLKGARARALEAEAGKLLAQHRADYRERFLEAGAAGRLLAAGELSEVLPLDDEALLQTARPVLPDSTVRADPEKVRAREDAQVWAALASSPCVLIVLGGDHDLSASVQRLGKGSCEYLRVTTKRYAEFNVTGRGEKGG